MTNFIKFTAAAISLVIGANGAVAPAAAEQKGQIITMQCSDEHYTDICVLFKDINQAPAAQPVTVVPPKPQLQAKADSVLAPVVAPIPSTGGNTEQCNVLLAAQSTPTDWRCETVWALIPSALILREGMDNTGPAIAWWALKDLNWRQDGGGYMVEVLYPRVLDEHWPEKTICAEEGHFFFSNDYTSANRGPFCVADKDVCGEGDEVQQVVNTTGFVIPGQIKTTVGRFYCFIVEAKSADPLKVTVGAANQVSKATWLTPEEYISVIWDKQSSGMYRGELCVPNQVAGGPALADENGQPLLRGGLTVSSSGGGFHFMGKNFTEVFLGFPDKVDSRVHDPEMVVPLYTR